MSVKLLTEHHLEFLNLTLKAPITTVADVILCNIFSNFQIELGMIFHENRLPVDDSCEISCLIC